MVRFNNLYALPLFILQICQAQNLAHNAYCITAIDNVYNKILFVGAKTGGGKSASCPSKLQALAIYGAAYKYCTRDEFVVGVQLLNGTCIEANKTLTPLSLFTNLSSSVDSWPVLVQGNYTASNFSNPVLIEKAWYDLSYRTVSAWNYEAENYVNYSWVYYGFWAFIVLIGIIRNIYSSFFISDTASTQNLEGAETKAKASNKIKQWVVTNIALAPLIGSYRRRLFLWCTVPTRLEAFVIYFYWIISLVLCCVNYQTFNGNLYWSNAQEQGLRYIADRTGVATFANLPIVWLFAGRNNILLWATGWNFSTFNLFHRHIARVATLEALVHAICHTVQAEWDDRFISAWTAPFWVWGVVAMVLMCFLVATASVFVRARAYEVFLLLHIFMAAVVIYSLFQHTVNFHGEFDPYLWPVVAIWSFDRLLRVIRILVCNIGFSHSWRPALIKSKVEYNSTADILKITLILPPRSLMQLSAPQPGQYAYLYRPLSWKGWENHPFTVGWSSSDEEIRSVADVLGTSSQEAFDEKRTEIGVRISELKPLRSGRTLTFWVRPFSGWTRRLARQCSARQAGTGNKWTALWTSTIWLEGPYYNHHENILRDNDRLLLIAGGTGISAVAPWIKKYIEETASRQCSENELKDKIRTRNIHLVWANKGREFIQSVCENELSQALSRGIVTFEAHDTLSQLLSQKKNDQSGLNVCRGRPNIAATILEHAALRRDRLAVVVCGAAEMADEARAAVIRARRDARSAEVQYVEEAFGW